MKMIELVIAVSVSVILLVMILTPVIEQAEYGSANTLDVIIIDGQSNAEYSTSINRVNPNLIDLPLPEHKLLYYGTESAANNFIGSYTPTGIYEMNRNDHWVIGGLEPTLAYYYSERSHHDVLTINVAVGAQSISALAPEGTYGHLGIEAINDALSLVTNYNINMVGWVMLQGEKDKNMQVDTYKEYFMQLSDYFDSIGAEQCYLVKTREYYGGNATIAQDELVSEYPNIHMATTITETFTEANGYLVNNDPIHYSQLGRNVIGEAVGEYMEIYELNGSLILELIPTIILIAIMLLAVAGIGIVIIKGNND